MLYHAIRILKSNDSGILATVCSIHFTHLVVHGANNSILQVHARDHIAHFDFESLDDVHDDENTGQVDGCNALPPDPGWCSLRVRVRQLRDGSIDSEVSSVGSPRSAPPLP